MAWITPGEPGWFALGDALPGLSMDAERAARRASSRRAGSASPS
jgi:hypothetical protein